jgi:hypothetical protein
LVVPQIFRVCAAALALTSLSFVTGVAGDLSLPPPVHGASVVVRIPPPLATEAPSTSPLPRTAAAQARTVRAEAAATRVVSAAAEAETERAPDPAVLVAEHELFHSAPADLALAAKPNADWG